jgi:hypothetical protein
MRVLRYGNVWEPDAVAYRVVTTNGVRKKDGSLVMGAGVAFYAATRYPDLPKLLGDWVKSYGNRVFIVQKYRILTLPTKYHWKDKSDIGLIQISLKQMVEVVDKFNIEVVYMPAPGCGNGKLDWETQVRPICAQVLDKRFTVMLNEG